MIEMKLLYYIMESKVDSYEKSNTIYIYTCMYIQWGWSIISTINYVNRTVYIFIYCTAEEGDRVVENFGCVIIVIIIFIDQNIEFFSCFIYIYSAVGVLFQQYYVCIYMHKAQLCV